jgi:hypothetical protein
MSSKLCSVVLTVRAVLFGLTSTAESVGQNKATDEKTAAKITVGPIPPGRLDVFRWDCECLVTLGPYSMC